MKNEKDLSFEEIVQAVISEVYGYPEDDEKPATKSSYAPLCSPDEVAEFRRAQNAGYGMIGKGLWIHVK